MTDNTNYNNIPDQNPQKKKSTLNYLMNVKADTVVNQGFNLYLANCIEFFEKRYDNFIKENNGQTNVIELQDEKQQKIIFNQKSDILKHCMQVSVKFIEEKFKEPMANFSLCRSSCEKQYDSGILNYFYRESCFKECRKSMETETTPLVQEHLHNNTQFMENSIPDKQ
ncbi:hypothetical protein PPERSA_04930 [Pseudocohnilembus persalinus]|uniref:Uncharacterized protein n=1 Tax=Pseudocohnilembus persalinus TaxID=266149 RepID=A0A0V0R8E1_PSEPJ|nr:hypothetical protein PPERSA_04930 [Pseudocohnilembus persalinus]|eukprot:KRX10763.1 hypothetical protein PPERSA_04930 [Pseudocohnilembus persalinus]